MKKKKLTVLLAAAAAAMLLAGCGSSKAEIQEMTADYALTEAGASDGIYSKASENMAEMPAAEAAEPEEIAEEAAMDTGAGAAEAANAVNAGKKLIKTVNLSVETKEFDALVENVTNEIEALGGYVENFNTSRYSMEDVRSGNITARIPCDKLEGFLDRIAEQSNVTYRDEAVSDVTLQYVDMDSHKKSLIIERDRLLELLEKAETVEDLITIESRLSEVRYQIESMEAQLRTIDNQVSYSTVYINITEVQLLTPASDKSVWGEIAEGFSNNVHRVLSGLKHLAVELVISLPYIFVWVIGIGCLVGVIQLCRRASKKRKQKKQAAKQAAKQNAEQDYIIIPTGKEEDEQNGKTV